MKAFLQGRWFGHPLHPIFVHFPVALLPTSLILDILSLATGNQMWLRAATVTLLITVIGAVLSVIFGIAEFVDIPSTAARTHRTAVTHAILNMVASLLTVGSLIRHRAEWNNTSISIFAFLLTLVAVLVVAFSGYLGGRMIYDNHLGVGRDEATGHPYLREQGVVAPETNGVESGTAENARHQRVARAAGRQTAANTKR